MRGRPPIQPGRLTDEITPQHKCQEACAHGKTSNEIMENHQPSLCVSARVEAVPYVGKLRHRASLSEGKGTLQDAPSVTNTGFSPSGCGSLPCALFPVRGVCIHPGLEIGPFAGLDPRAAFPGAGSPQCAASGGITVPSAAVQSNLPRERNQRLPTPQHEGELLSMEEGRAPEELPGEDVGFPSLGTFQTHLQMSLCHLLGV